MTIKALRAGSLNDQLRVVRGDRGEDNARVCRLGVVDVGNEVCIAFGEVLGDDLAAERLKRFREVVDQTLIVVRAEHRQRVSGGNAELLECIVRKDGALERIEEADPVVDAAIGGHLRVGAGHADGRDAGFLEDRAARDRNARAVGAEDDRHAAVHKLGSSRGAVFRRRAVVDDLELHIVRLAADFHGGLYVVGILHAENLLFAASAVVAGLRLKDADLDDLVAGRSGSSFLRRSGFLRRGSFFGSGCFRTALGRCGRALAGAAGKDAEYHQNAKQ